MDFRGATNHFADPEFDGDPVQIYEPGEADPVTPPDAEPPGFQDGDQEDYTTEAPTTGVDDVTVRAAASLRKRSMSMASTPVWSPSVWSISMPTASS